MNDLNSQQVNEILSRLEDLFDADEMEEIVRVEADGDVVTLRAQPEERPKIPFCLSNDLASVLRDRRRVVEGMSE